jgi:hypothetical protein
MRAKRKEILFEREDWRLLLNPETISQKAGCHAHDIGEIVLKELVDNGLDAGANVDLQYEHGD